MRLTQIKLAGFKSFVDPTSISLPSNLVGVVGPNGCGKSNVIDAVRWVMGESSAKHLRGDSMADVIFNGSSDRKPVGQASIELLFDNSDGTLGGQYAEYNEISIKRQVTRDGQSSYFLNGTRCRRRDIKDIFLGTGLGARSYAIIEQGMISRLIEAKPDELRILLEEAAGISKYKERRRETETRLRHTQDNINRLNDIRDELGKRIESLRRQARQAEQYKELKQQERVTRSQLLALRWQSLDKEVAEQSGKIAEQETLLEKQVAAVRQIEAAIEDGREKQVEANLHFNQVQGKFYGVGAEIARLEQAIQHAREQGRQQKLDLEQTEQARAEALSHLDSDKQQIEALTSGLAETEPGYNARLLAAESSSERLAEMEAAMHQWQLEWDKFNESASARTQAVEVQKTRAEHLEQHLLTLTDRLRRLEEELGSARFTELDAEISTLNGQVGDIEQSIDALRDELQGLLREMIDQRENNHRCVAQLDQRRNELQGLQSEHASLDALQQAAFGSQIDSINAWLEQQGLQDTARLVQQLDVGKGWEQAVETVLGLHLNAVCVEGLDKVARGLAALTEGSLGAFDTTSARPGTDRGSRAPLLADFITAPWPMESLLAGVYAVDSLEDALSLHPRLGDSESVVTRDGIWIGGNWLRVTRNVDEKAGVLSREQSLKRLKTSLNNVHAAVEDLQETSRQGSQRLKELEEKREALQASLNSKAHERTRLREQLSARQANWQQLKMHCAKLRGEVDEIRARISRDDSELTAGRNRLVAEIEQIELVANQRDALIRQRDDLRSELDRIRAQARADKDATHELGLKLHTMRTQLDVTRGNLARMENQLGHLDRRHHDLTNALCDGEKPVESFSRDLEVRLKERLTVETELAQARRTVENCDEELRQSDDRRHRTEQEVQQVRERLEQLRMSGQEIRVRRQTLEEQLAEGDFKLPQLIEEMPPAANEHDWQQELEQLMRKTQRLEPVNLAAIDEFNQESERKSYLDAQHEDLTKALTTLENAIGKIDRETRTRFKETFDKVNEGLQLMFPRLFGGGRAYLELTGDNLLDTGVTVMARPPGKKNSTIHLLSGGEKALTAIAMVFAIFELNPAPFCMLDEVDAPLDDNNVVRFCSLVAEMSKRIQFVFITHNKVTMEMAHQLIGVTMSEPGVSRLVAVDVDEAVGWAEVSAAGTA
ncbi:MAG: chromosome segregation protein [Gammaproteobacteria bacterium]|nr:MAG: chromosome segregation protein [Gammaproteobacteria bacterium]TND06897.1 MAG: chromosome segregation protein [Gammaproteobacteria bacterium]